MNQNGKNLNGDNSREQSSKNLRELHGRRLIGFCSGSFGRMLANTTIGTFSIQYYIYVLNLDASVTIIGSVFFSLLSAFFSLTFGVLIDNKKPGKLGKRRPFLLYGLGFWFIPVILIWMPPYFPFFLPPQSENTVIYWPTTIFLWIISITRSISGSLLMIANSSMLPEQSQTLKNRL